jgi:hypothetical protein
VAGFAGVAAVGKSLERLLNAGFDEEQQDADPQRWLVPNKKTKAVLVRTADFEESVVGTNIGSPALSIFLYRVDFNKMMRAAWSAVGSQDGFAHLPLDLHFLLTPWADNAEFEHRILGKAMQCLETTPMFSGPLLYPSPFAGWAPNESIQIVLEDVSTEALMRTFDSLPTDYRLSVPYIARITRIDGRQASIEPPVTTAITGLKPSLSS